jgi:hypothetical protein
LSEPHAITPDDVARAAERIRGHVLRTPLVPAPRLSELTGARVLVKHENMQVKAPVACMFSCFTSTRAPVSSDSRGAGTSGVRRTSLPTSAAAAWWRCRRATMPRASPTTPAGWAFRPS